MLHKAWSSIEEVPYCFSRSSIKFQVHIALEIVEFDSNWAFLDCNSSLNSTMAMKCCTKLETAKKRCPIVFQGHPSNFKVTRDKTSPILTQIGRFGLQAGRSFQIPQICLVSTKYGNNISEVGSPGWLETLWTVGQCLQPATQIWCGSMLSLTSVVPSYVCGEVMHLYINILHYDYYGMLLIIIKPYSTIWHHKATLR